MAVSNSINEQTTGITGFTGTAFVGTAATNHAIIVGGSTSSTLTNVGPTATAGQILQSAGSSADPVFSTATYPSTAGTSGKVLVSNGTNIVSSTPTFPNASATSRKIIVSDGTNWVASTETWAVPGTSGNLLTSNGTNWTSAAAPAAIATINADSGSITGTTVTIRTNQASRVCGQTVLFTGSSTTSTLTVSDASSNTCIGELSGKSGMSGANNTALGKNSLTAATTADSNDAFGSTTLANCTQGQFNVACGSIALSNLTTTSQNTAIGRGALSNIVTGAGNVALGYNSGQNCTTNDSNNIFIGNVGVAGDNAKIKIGTNGTHTQCTVQGISGVTVTGAAVICSTAGLLGTVVSSERYKESIEDMPAEISVLNLRPIKFKYKSDEKKKDNFGLLAEDVDKEFPYLCLYDDQGKPESVKYHELCVFLLKEVQRLNDRLSKLEKGFNI